MKIAFLDRDGVINIEVDYLHLKQDFEYTVGCVEALLKIQKKGFEIVIVTNQAGIARGYYSERQYHALTKWYLTDLASKGVEIMKVIHCPHHPNGIIPELSVQCGCRKPETGMFECATEGVQVNLNQCFMVGDKESDLIAAEKFGVKKCFLVKSGHELPAKVSERWIVSEDLAGVAELV